MPLVVSEVGVGYHTDGVEPGSCPSTRGNFWLENVLIQLCSCLTLPDIADISLMTAVKFGRETNPSSRPFDILLISIEHIVIARVFDDHIGTTETLTLLHVPMHFTIPPCQCYPSLEGTPSRTCMLYYY